jgi:hypothetical protein
LKGGEGKKIQGGLERTSLNSKLPAHRSFDVSFPQFRALAWFLKINGRRRILNTFKLFIMKKTVVLLLMTTICAGVTMAQKTVAKK